MTAQQAHTTDIVIIGAGLSGLVVAHRLKRHHPQRSFALLEKGRATGGVIRSHEESGYRAEIGPHGFLDNCSESLELLRETGLDRECVKAPLSTFVRYVCRNGRLMMIPQSPLKIIRAPLIPWKAKLRVLGDLFKKPLDGEPTVAKWADYRFGRALLPYLDAVFTGTYAGDYNKLRIDAVMPGVRAMEHHYGSIIRGVLARALQARKKNKLKGGGKLEMPSMTSFPEGMQRLPEKLTEVLRPDSELFLEHPVEQLRKTTNGWHIKAGGTDFAAATVVLALPVNQALALLDDLDPDRKIDRIPEAWIATVVFGFGSERLPPGFGFLIPEVERRFSLGTLFSSNMFPDRAPAGDIVIEILVGGRRHPERLQLSDRELADGCLEDIRDLLGLQSAPKYTRVLRPEGGIPQLEEGYVELLDWRSRLVRENPGLYLCGFGWDGIGINDMIKTATAVAAKAGAGQPQFSQEAELKKIYF